MFAVFGISKKIAEAELSKKLRNRSARFTKAYNEAEGEERQKMYDEELERLYSQMKPRQVSGELSSPGIAQQMLSQMKANPLFSKLMIKARVPSRDKSGNIKRSKQSGKVSMKWVPINEFEEHLNSCKADAA